MARSLGIVPKSNLFCSDQHDVYTVHYAPPDRDACPWDALRMSTAVPPSKSAHVAAVDLGSNSFHMVVARETGGQLQIVDRLRESVRLVAGLDASAHLDESTQARALDSLSRLGQRLRDIPPARVRAVGTNTLRKLCDDGQFIVAAEQALGHEIEIISGQEEARLVYAGVVRDAGVTSSRRLVVDIGGGSTELIVGRGAEPKLMESVGLGCVTHTARYFGDGVVTRAGMRKARLAARVEMEFLERRYRKTGWDIALGASGSVRGVWRVMQAQGWTDELITREALKKVVALTVDAGTVSRIDFPGLREDRRPIFAGGLAVLAGVFDALDLEVMQASDRALREGVIYDLLGRLADHDVRSRSVMALARRYGVDAQQARRVERTALRLFEHAADAWSLDRVVGVRLLGWAARLHEIGLSIAHDGYQRHGEYILRHGDLSGFSQTDQKLLAALVRLQRGKFSISVIDDLPKSWRDTISRLAVLFRLAVLLHRSRMPTPRPAFRLELRKRALQLQFILGWLGRHPLTCADLEVERGVLQGAGFKLNFE